MLKKSININKDEDAFVQILTLHMYSVMDFERSVGKKSINTNTAFFDLLYNIFIRIQVARCMKRRKVLVELFKFEIKERRDTKLCHAPINYQI